MQLFENRDYRRILEDIINGHQHIRGYQSKLAEAANCQKSYFSRVLKGNANLSDDQAFALTRFFQWTQHESEIFILLVARDRAGTVALKEHLNRKIDAMIKDQQKMIHQFDDVEVPDEANHDFYYTSWIWSAIHILVGMPGFHEESRIAQHLQLPIETTRHCLQKLALHGFVKYSSTGWQIHKRNVHQPGDRLAILPYHQSWRQKALSFQPRLNPSDIFYTSVQSVGTEDMRKIQAILKDSIKHIRDQVVASETKEHLIGLNVDFFTIA